MLHFAIKYMYTGQVTLSSDEVNLFMDTCSFLEIPIDYPTTTESNPIFTANESFDGQNGMISVNSAIGPVCLTKKEMAPIEKKRHATSKKKINVGQNISRSEELQSKK